MGLIVSIDGIFQEFSPDVKHDDLWLDEDDAKDLVLLEPKGPKDKNGNFIDKYTISVETDGK